MTSVSTIVALSSAPGRAGVAVFRASGPQAGAILDAVAPPRPRPRTAALRAFRHPLTGELLDRGIVLWLPAPASVTGEDVAEFHGHGGRAVSAALLEALRAVPGCRLAEAGEFTRRAFANGKMDLAEAEGLADLIDAETAAQRQQALRLAGGEFTALYGGWRRAAIEAMALIEAAIDFADEGDVEAGAARQGEAVVRALAAEISLHLDDGHRGEILRDGFRVVLAGPPNAGKSSLLNALARRNVAIVSAEAGTTRDVIEVRLDLAGLPVVLVDTAGLRDAAGEAEKEGVRRALAETRGANLVLWLNSIPAPPAAMPAEVRECGAVVLPVWTKADLAAPRHAKGPGTALAVSAKTGEGLNRLIEVLTAEARTAIGSLETLAVTQARHRAHLEMALRHLNAVLADREARGLELQAEDLRQAANALGRITGRVDPEEVLDQVFRRFCIGK